MDENLMNCLSCGNHEYIELPYIGGKETSQFINWNNYSIKCCKACGLGFVTPTISLEILDKFYFNEYEKNKRAFNSNFFNDSIYLPAMSQALNLSIFWDIHNKNEINFLDLGCGAFGYLFNSIRQLYPGKKINYFGIDSSDLAVKYLKLNHINFLGQNYHCLEKTSVKFDAIVLSHCLEHFEINDAINFLGMARQSLDVDGKLFIEVPYDDLRITVRQGIPSSPHTIFFTKVSLENLIKKAGYKICFSQTFCESRVAYWRRISQTHDNTDGIIRKLKLLVPINWKVKIKRMFKSGSASHMLSNAFDTNKEGFILRIIAEKDTN